MVVPRSLGRTTNSTRNKGAVLVVAAVLVVVVAVVVAHVVARAFALAARLAVLSTRDGRGDYLELESVDSVLGIFIPLVIRVSG